MICFLISIEIVNFKPEKIWTIKISNVGLYWQLYSVHTIQIIFNIFQTSINILTFQGLPCVYWSILIMPCSFVCHTHTTIITQKLMQKYFVCVEINACEIYRHLRKLTGHTPRTCTHTHKQIKHTYIFTCL